jgi:hypothetical protein
MRFRRPTWSFWLLAILLLPLAAVASARALPCDATAIAVEAAAVALEAPVFMHKALPASLVRPAARQSAGARDRAGPEPETPEPALSLAATVPAVSRCAASCRELQSWRLSFLKLRALGPRAPPSQS